MIKPSHRTSAFCGFGAVLMAFVMSAPTAAQRAPDVYNGELSQEVGEKSKSSDVIVTATPEKSYSITVKLPSSFQEDVIIGRQAAGDAQIFGRCIKDQDKNLFRQLADSPQNTYASSKALDEIIRSNSSCYPGFGTIASATPNYFGDCNPRGTFMPVFDVKTHRLVGSEPVHVICQAFFDRGAVIERLINLYSSKVELTATELNDREVVARFLARERRFNKFRTKGERLYAAVVGCLVEGHPETALAYVRAVANTVQETRLRMALIEKTPACLGGAKNLEADPSQFRVFTADAVYSWLIAAQGVDSLVPAK